MSVRMLLNECRQHTLRQHTRVWTYGEGGGESVWLFHKV